MFGLVEAGGSGAPFEGAISFVSPPNGASSFRFCSGDSERVVASIVEGAQTDETTRPY